MELSRQPRIEEALVREVVPLVVDLEVVVPRLIPARW